MNKDIAKSVAKNLKTKSLTRFALAPNGDHPVLILDKIKLTAGIVKKRAEEELGVVYKGGSIFLGEVDRSTPTTVFVVDEEASVGNLDTKKAILALRKLRQDLAGHGQKADALTKFKIRLGDQLDEHDVTKDLETASKLPETLARMNKALDQQKVLASALSHATKSPPDLSHLKKLDETVGSAQKRLGVEIRGIRDALKLELETAGEAALAHKDDITDLQARLRGLFVLLDPTKEAARTTSAKDAAIPIDTPADLATDEKHIRPLLAELNKAIGKDDVSLKQLSDQAWNVSNACAERLKELKGRWFKDKKKMAALLEVQRKAEGMALAIQARVASAKAMEANALLQGGDTEALMSGVNKARFVKKDGKSRFLVKTNLVENDKDHAEDYLRKVKEFGAEVGSSAMGSTITTALGLPRLITPTFTTVVTGPRGPAIAGVQDVWPSSGSLDKRFAHRIKIGEKEVLVSPGDWTVIRNLTGKGAREAAQHFLGDQVKGFTEGELDQLALEIKQRQPKDLEDVFGLDEDDLAEDIAGIAIVDLLTGQRDHRRGKEDNMIIVEIDGKRRLRPIDYGETMHGPDGETLDEMDFGAWSDDPAAQKPMKKELLEKLVQLDVEDVIGAGKQASRESGVNTGDPRMEVDDDRMALVRFQGACLQRAVYAALQQDKRPSPRDLADLFSTHVAPILTEVKNAAKAGEPWAPVLKAGLDGFEAAITKWLKTVQ